MATIFANLDNKVITATFRFFPRLLCCDNRVLKQEIPKSEMYLLSQKPVGLLKKNKQKKTKQFV